jgi:hypothetical protein
MLKYFKVYNINSPKIRLGSQSDGGYVVPELILEKCTSLLTYGYGGDKSYEDAFIAKYDKPNYIFDHTMNQEKWSIGEQYYYPEGLGNSTYYKEESNRLFQLLNSKKDEISNALETFSTNQQIKNVKSLKKVLNDSYELSKQLMDSLSLKTPREHYDQLKLEGDIFLKIDTEGAEYDYVINEDIDDLASFTVGIILEVHWIDQPQNQTKFVEMMEKLSKHFVLTHVHGNNWGGEFVYEGHTLPKVPEFTFVNKKYVSDYQSDMQYYPIEGLDFPNNPNIPDCDLSFLKQL